MHSRGHAILSAILAIVLTPLLSPPISSIVLIAYVLALGVGIDFDQFLLARISVGNWKHLRKVISNPMYPIFNQSAIFEPGVITAKGRLVSHALITVSLVGIFVILDMKIWAGVSAATLMLHILTDWVHDKTNSQ